MEPLFDPAVFVMLPGCEGVATTRSTLAPCPCGNAHFEVVRSEGGRITCQCPDCVRRKGVVVGFISMISGQGRAVGGS